MFSRSYYPAAYFPIHYFAPALHFGWFAHNYFPERWYTSWYYCPSSNARSTTHGFSVITRPQVSLAPEGQVLDWRVISRPSVSFTARTDLRIGWTVISAPTVELAPATAAKHGEFVIIEKPQVKWVVTIGKTTECISADGSFGEAALPNAVY